MQDSWVSLDYQVALGLQDFLEVKGLLEALEEMDFQVDLDSLDRKVREDTPALLACPVFLFHQSWWRKETLDFPGATAFLASLDPEVTKVCRVYLVVRVCLDFPALLSRVKDSLDSPAFLGSLELQAFLDRREKLESWDSLACQDHGVMMVHLVSLAALENLVDLVEKVCLEILMVILEGQELKACQETQASQVAVATTAPSVTTVFQEVQASLEQRVVQVKEDGLE